MINIFTNKLPSSKGNDIIWMNNNSLLYDRFNQITNNTPNTPKASANIPKVLNIVPITENRLLTIIKDSPLATQMISDINIDSIASMPKTKTIPKEKAHSKDKRGPMKIILEESQTYDTYRDDVRDKIINLISTKEFNKVFGITKSAEIMSGIANDRFNKSTVLFISFLFDKCVIYNNKNVIYNKNNGIIIVS